MRVSQWESKCVLPLLLLGLFAGCRSAPIQNVVDAPVALWCVEATADDIDEAIWRAGRKVDWRIERIGPGNLRGTLRVKHHVAVVSLTHHDGNLSIRYVDSENLRHEGGEIHRNYNVLVQRLLKQIQLEPVTLESGALCPPTGPPSVKGNPAFDPGSAALAELTHSTWLKPPLGDSARGSRSRRSGRR